VPLRGRVQVPVFAYRNYSFHVDEQRAAGTPVGRVRAIDADLPPHNAVHYSIDRASLATATTPSASSHYDHTPGGSTGPAPAFRISNNGTILTRRPLDRELTDYFRFDVRACSPAHQASNSNRNASSHAHNTSSSAHRASNPAHSASSPAPRACSTAHVTVHVTDVNDHAPVFLFPVAPNHTVSITRRLRRGDVVARLVATDADVGDNGRVEYRLADVDRVTDFYFRLDAATGAVVARRDDVPAAGSYTLPVAALDAGTPRRRSVPSALTLVVNISTSGHQPAARSHVAAVVVVVGTSLPVAVLLLAAILVVHRDAGRGAAAARSRDVVYASQSCKSYSPVGAQYATVSRARTVASGRVSGAGTGCEWRLESGVGVLTVPPPSGRCTKHVDCAITSYQQVCSQRTRLVLYIDR